MLLRRDSLRIPKIFFTGEWLSLRGLSDPKNNRIPASKLLMKKYVMSYNQIYREQSWTLYRLIKCSHLCLFIHNRKISLCKVKFNHNNSKFSINLCHHSKESIDSLHHNDKPHKSTNLPASSIQ